MHKVCVGFLLEHKTKLVQLTLLLGQRKSFQDATKTVDAIRLSAQDRTVEKYRNLFFFRYGCELYWTVLRIELQIDIQAEDPHWWLKHWTILKMFNLVIRWTDKLRPPLKRVWTFFKSRKKYWHFADVFFGLKIRAANDWQEYQLFSGGSIRFKQVECYSYLVASLATDHSGSDTIW